MIHSVNKVLCKTRSRNSAKTPRCCWGQHLCSHGQFRAMGSFTHAICLDFKYCQKSQ